MLFSMQMRRKKKAPEEKDAAFHFVNKSHSNHFTQQGHCGMNAAKPAAEYVCTGCASSSRCNRAKGTFFKPSSDQALQTRLSCPGLPNLKKLGIKDTQTKKNPRRRFVNPYYFCTSMRPQKLRLSLSCDSTLRLNRNNVWGKQGEQFGVHTGKDPLKLRFGCSQNMERRPRTMIS